MKLLIMSDLHLEFNPEFRTTHRGEDALLLMGDILPVGRLNSNLDFFHHVADTHPKTYMIMGNHEHYRGEVDTSGEKIKDFLYNHNLDNIQLLDSEYHDYNDDVRIIGVTLWTDMEGGHPHTKYAVQNTLNDYRLIRIANEGYRRLYAEWVVAKHYAEKQFIEESIDPSMTNVVMTHHAPTYASRDHRYDDRLLEGGYSSDLSGLIMGKETLKLWCHGHIHVPHDYMVDQTRVVCNPKGYGKENPMFNEQLIIEV